MILNCELLDLRAFVAVADGKSFQGAAAQLHLSQPALSRRIQKLETAVGTPLLQRSTRHVRLSPAGQEVLPMLRRLLDEMDSSLFGMMALGERRAGKLTIASVPSATVRFLPEVVQQFSQEYPNVRVRILDLSATECAQAVRAGEAEIGLSLPPPPGGDLEFEPLHDDPYGLVCRVDDPLAQQDTVGWGDLIERRLVTVHRESGNRTTLEAGLAEAGINLKWFYEVTRLSSALALVHAGLGPSVMPRMACGGHDGRELVWRPLSEPTISRSIGLLRRPAVMLSASAARMLALLTAAWAAEF